MGSRPAGDGRATPACLRDRCLRPDATSNGRSGAEVSFLNVFKTGFYELLVKKRSCGIERWFFIKDQKGAASRCA